MTVRITSTANPRIRALAQLKDRKARTTTGRFLIEGHRELARAVAAGIEVEEIVLAPELASDRESALASELVADGLRVLEVGRAAFERISMRRHPDGLVGVARARPHRLSDLSLPADPLILVIEGVEKPGNLGAMLRTADGAGVDAVVVADGGSDITNPNVIRASQGAVFSVPVAVAPADTTIEWLTARGLRTIAASPEAERTLWDTDLTGSVAIVVGAEAAGVSPVFRTPDTIVAIPMAGRADSLNTSVAAAVMLYEATRQRR